ncbi:hypothetical protein J7354_01385 [Sulfitobacter sp. R18_2]|uniref:hypothetical protein n=1 Tax=Sulfitobacter sp. R18_2 TaxID=2821105 RepID=UPI001AD9DB6C|nr:hypothetical protein [Sulfitobacter sp. R18_2]MBO9437303.1 hypothetical protein [Sulfitobacter sp. R18_2]
MADAKLKPGQDPERHPDCPRCKGQGFYLAYAGRGYYPDGSFGHNQWKDCWCDPWQKPETLPAAVNPGGY